MKNDFGKVLKDIKDFTLDWAYPELDASRQQVIPVPDEVLKVAANIPTINGDECLHGTFNVWLAFSMPAQPFPLDSSLPSVLTGVQLRDELIQQPPYYSWILEMSASLMHESILPETVAVTRLTLLLFVCPIDYFKCFLGHQQH